VNKELIFAIIASVIVMICGCANFDRYNTNPFFEQKKSAHIADSNEYIVIPSSEAPEQTKYFSNISSVLISLGLTVSHNPFSDSEKGQSSDAEQANVDNPVTSNQSQSKPQDGQNGASVDTAGKTPSHNQYSVITHFDNDGNNTVTFIRMADNTVIGTFNISPDKISMRPQLYEALVKMKLIAGMRYFQN
jgi:hypothetical protein